MRNFLFLIYLLSFFAVSLASEARAVTHDQSINQHIEFNKNTETVTDNEYTDNSYNVIAPSVSVDKPFVMEVEIPLHLIIYTMKRPPRI